MYRLFVIFAALISFSCAKKVEQKVVKKVEKEIQKVQEKAPAKMAVSFIEPKNGAQLKNPVKVCIGAEGLIVEPAKNGKNEGKGHHHILVDAKIPGDLSMPIVKDEQHIHMGDGSTCKELTLKKGKHTLRLLFADGHHVPYNPALSSEIEIEVTE